MGKQYMVTVSEVDTEDDEVRAVLVELRAPAEMLRQFAPSAVAAALGSTVSDEVPGGVYGAETDPGPEVQPKTRRRRTKAEMEAVRAAEAHPAPEIHTEPFPAEAVPDAQVEKAEPQPAYSPFA